VEHFYASLVILAALLFEIVCRKKTDTQTNWGKTDTNAVGMGNNN